MGLGNEGTFWSIITIDGQTPTSDVRSFPQTDILPLTQRGSVSLGIKWENLIFIVTFIQPNNVTTQQAPCPLGVSPHYLTARKVNRLSAPRFRVAAALLPPTVVIVTWAVLSSHREAYLRPHCRWQTSTTPSATLRSPSLLDRFVRRPRRRTAHRHWALRCPLLRPVARAHHCEPSTLAWPTCSVAAYDGADLTLRREDGICDVKNTIFHPEPPAPQYTLDATTTHPAILFRALHSLRLDPHQVIGHLSDHLRYIACLLRVLSDSLLLYLDWPIVHTLFGNVLHLVAVAVGTSVSHIHDAQVFRHLVDLFGNEYSPLQAQLLLETARQMTDPITKLGCLLSGFLVHVVELISRLRLSTESKVDWTPVLPLPQHWRRPIQLILVLVWVSSFYMDYRQLWVSRSFFNTFSLLHFYQLKHQRCDRKTGTQGADAKVHGTTVRLSFHVVTFHCLPFLPNTEPCKVRTRPDSERGRCFSRRSSPVV